MNPHARWWDAWLGTHMGQGMGRERVVQHSNLEWSGTLEPERGSMGGWGGGSMVGRGGGGGKAAMAACGLA